MSKIVVSIGDKYNFLTIIKEVEKYTKPSWINIRMFMCKCVCDKIVIRPLSRIRNWQTRSCWCYQKLRSTTHWMFWTKIYWVFAWIKRRCENINVKNYHRYWARWIKCEWKTFEDFYKDMWPTYKKWLSIDRINNNWNYCKSNCKWSTPKEQARNTTKTLFYKWRTVRAICEEIGLNFSTFNSRKNTWGWDMERAIFTKTQKN